MAGILVSAHAWAAPLIVTVGDSTVANAALAGKTRGWGQMLPEYFKPAATFNNKAVNGTSSKSYYDLPAGASYWSTAVALKGDYVLIQFGTNDVQVRADLHTDPATTYRDYLRLYIDEARAAGSKPVLVTPVGQQVFKADGTIENAKLRSYASAMAFVAQEKGVPLIDLNASSVAMYERLGPAATDLLFIRRVDGSPDSTHFNIDGARAIAQLVTTELAADVPDLAPLIVPEPALVGVAGIMLVLFGRRRNRAWRHD